MEGVPQPFDFDETDPFADEMSDKDAREIEQRMNIHRLKNEANELAGGGMTSWESGDVPPGISEQFWQNVVNFERAPLRTIHQKLEAANIPMPSEGELSDEELHARLWQIIEFLATQNTFLSDTNHLSDRELYTHLRDDSFHEPSPDFSGMNCHLSPIGSCGDDDMLIHFRFYSDDSDRASWMSQFPDYEMPEPETAPFDRDRLLPQANYSVGNGENWDDDWNDEEPDQG